MKRTTVILLSLLAIQVSLMLGMEVGESGGAKPNQKTRLQSDVDTTKELFEEAYNIFTSSDISDNVLNSSSVGDMRTEINEIAKKLLKISRENVSIGSERHYIERSYCDFLGIAQNIEQSDEKDLISKVTAKRIYGIYGRMDLIFMRTCGARADNEEQKGNCISQ